ncbi:MAG: hypothetical protein ABI629_04240 [bacterium]
MSSIASHPSDESAGAGSPPRQTSRYRQIGEQRRQEALAAGYLQRHFFPHRFYYLPKCGPDGFKLAQWMCGATDPSACWQIVLYADAALLSEFPAELFFDDDLVWHQQQFGRSGQIASANLVVDGATIYTMAHVSDVVQRIGRFPAYRTRIEKRFRGWHHMLLNSVANFALERGATRVLSPQASLALQHTDRQRTVQRDLFERIYDRDVCRRFPSARREGPWWVIDAAALAAAAVVADPGSEPLRAERVVCIVHDTERGLGHRDVEPAFALEAERDAPGHLAAMLAIERAAGVRTTYAVVGNLLNEIRPSLAADAHCVAFHSYDHAPPGADGKAPPQLRACRSVDYRLKGYRVPRSRLTEELTEAQLCTYNFEWLAIAAKWLVSNEPRLSGGIVKIPIAFDDYRLHTATRTYDEWRRQALATVGANWFTAFGLHDCYAAHWLPHYAELLADLQSMATLHTLDAVAARATLAQAG